jgi:outer membrane scaffolding protein for murein synthesis (MipA/OmpV family)
MIKSLKRIASGVVASAALALASSASMAGPYANIENNASYVEKYTGSNTDLHVGFEGGEGPYSFYAQGGFALVDDTSAVETELSGKIGAAITLADSGLNFYGEFSGITTDDEPAFATKWGVKAPF